MPRATAGKLPQSWNQEFAEQRTGRKPWDGHSEIALNQARPDISGHLMHTDPANSAFALLSRSMTVAPRGMPNKLVGTK